MIHSSPRGRPSLSYVALMKTIPAIYGWNLAEVHHEIRVIKQELVVSKLGQALTREAKQVLNL